MSGRENKDGKPNVKREAFRHPKTLDLAARLQLPHAYAFAHVCYMLNAAADIAAQGNIGKWPNGVIARSSEWIGDPDAFVTALTTSGWLDAHPRPDVRLLIHDWPEHAERFVKAKLVRERSWFHWAYYAGTCRTWDSPDGLQLVIPDDYCTPSLSVEPSVVTTIDASPPCDPTQPNPTNPNPTKPVLLKTGYSPVFESWYLKYPRHVGKQQAAAAFGRAIDRIMRAKSIDRDAALAWLSAVTLSFSMSPAGKAGEFTPHPASWLNSGRYDDDPNEWNRVSNGRTLPHVIDAIGDEG